jgi:putative transposase
MTEPTIALVEYLRNLDSEGDFLREAMLMLVRLLMEAEVGEQIGAERYERSEERTAQRNGYREREWETRVGELPLRIPKLRRGTYFPSFLEPRRRAERALLAVIQAAYVEGVSTRKVDDLVQALGLSGVDKSKVSRICRELDEAVAAFRQRPLEAAYPYLWLDALYMKVRQNGRIVNMAAVIAIGVRETGERDILAVDVGASEESAFWTAFLRGLVARGLKGVQLVISDAHQGLKEAIRTVLAGAVWQRCRVHFMRNVLAHVPKGDKSIVAAAIRTIFAQPSQGAARQQVTEVVQAMAARWPRAAAVLEEGVDDVLAYMTFPPEHWTRIYSTNPLERLNREVKRRTDVVGIFPD